MRAPRWTIVAGALVVIAAVGAAIVLLTGGSGSSSDDTASDGGTIPANYQNYHQVQFGISITNSWRQDRHDRRPRVGDYLESTWLYPAHPAAGVAVFSRSSDGSGPAAAADLAQVQTKGLPGYQERGLKRISLRGHPAVRWNFALAGTVYLEYFLEECEVSLVFRGSAPRNVWPELSSIFDETAKSITAKCDK